GRGAAAEGGGWHRPGVTSVSGGLLRRLEQQESGLTVVGVRDWVVAAVGGGVDSHDVGAVGEVGAAGDGEPAVVLVEDGDPAAFGGDLKPTGTRGVGGSVGGAAH